MRRRFGLAFELSRPAFTLGDGLILLIIGVVIYIGARLALRAPATIAGPEISLAPAALPWYAFLSTSRMFAAYLISLIITLVYGYVAARNRTAEKVMMPALDVLQSVPILSFLPVVLLSFTAILPEALAVELASVILIVTGMAWNMVFSFYQSMTTIPSELREASAIFRMNPWLRFKTLELPFSMTGLIWNSMMSWAGGWFFLMAAESFTVGNRNFGLPGLGSYLQTAANAGDVQAILLGIATLVIVIVLLDQLMWRPILVWAAKFKLEMVEGGDSPQSWFYDRLHRSWIAQNFDRNIWHPVIERIDYFFGRRFRSNENSGTTVKKRPSILVLVIAAAAVIGLGYLAIQAAGLLITVPLNEWGMILAGVLATMLRVIISLILAVAWTIPVGVWIGSNPRVANVLQPIAQIAASIPATALFPVIVAIVIGATGGLNTAAILLMLLGTQWYVLFNVIAGASSIPQDLNYTTSLLQIKGWARWRTLILPALYPFLVTGMITAAGGAWNASIVAEYVTFGGQTYSVTGIGSTISQATAAGNYALLLAATLALIITVVTINRLFWRRLYRRAEANYRME